MANYTKFNELLYTRKLIEAESILKTQLSKAEILDPSDGSSWAQYADLISNRFETNIKRYEFWKGLLSFFEDDLEKKWGHLHKGHIFFRLGITIAYEDVKQAKSWLMKALEEDRLLEKNKETGDVDKAITNYSAHVVLCIIERIDDSELNSEEKQKLFKGFFSSFDAAIFGQQMNQELVNKSIARIVPKELLDHALEVKQELDTASRQGLQTATISLAGSLMESILLGILFYKYNRTSAANKKDIREIDLGSLLKEADKLKKENGDNVFPSDSIKASCGVIHSFRNRLHPGNELKQKYKLTERVAVTVKNLLDSTLIDWSNNLQ